MNAKHVGALTAALLTATALTACGSSDDQQDSSVAFSQVTGDDFTSNPGAFQTDGVPVPEKGVTMVGDPVAAQAVANAGLEQGTITASSDDGTTVFYPKAPPVPGLPVAEQEVAPPPPQLTRPVNTRPWNYTPYQITVYRQICETGRWNDWVAGAEVQSQTCWTVYGRQLGVRPWYPGQPKPWERPTWPKPWYEPTFRADVPVMWVYPRDWSRPRPQPIVSVSIGLNVPQNPHARPNPRFRDDPYVPVWAVTPGRPVAARDQARVVAPWLAYDVTPTGRYTPPPVYPGTVLAAVPTSGRAEVVTALPGGDGEWSPNRDRTVLVPSARAIAGASVYNGTRADVVRALGEDVDVRVATSRTRAAATTTTTTTAKKTTTTDKSADATSTTKTTDSDGTGAATTTRTTDRTTTTTTSEKPSSTKRTTTEPTTATTTAKTTTRSATKTTTTAPKTTTTTTKKRTTTSKPAATTTTTTAAR
ncbi:hypothetical protein FK529_02675 [Tsukamurella asaccharolytica]|uniref:Uncharacterized protein n=1 Tax=Tsukamurella asaccharolytica TaxID=2592067 RepID=A0A5C5RF89_9ACTN|nr:hypothetical protein [Tsukamurella asaccharolytica]TWS21510.1 hypothetical protein FK529_02675 [Tsukamurella asaccharolytica]